MSQEKIKELVSLCLFAILVSVMVVAGQRLVDLTWPLVAPSQTYVSEACQTQIDRSRDREIRHFVCTRSVGEP